MDGFQTGAVILRDILATLKWEIWERQGMESRSEIPENYWEEFIAQRQQEWRGYPMREQIINIYSKGKAGILAGTKGSEDRVITNVV